MEWVVVGWESDSFSYHATTLYQPSTGRFMDWDGSIAQFIVRGGSSNE